MTRIQLRHIQHQPSRGSTFPTVSSPMKSRNWFEILNRHCCSIIPAAFITLAHSLVGVVASKFEAELLYAARCSTTWDSYLLTAALPTALKWMAQTPRAIFCAVITSENRISTAYGRQLHCIRLPASLNTCIRSSPW